MDNNTINIELLFERVIEYGKTSYKLWRLKALDKATELLSSLISNLLIIVLALSFMLFLNLGLAFWLGSILGSIWYGFFILAAFYGIMTIFALLFIRKWIKALVNNFIINRAIK